MGSVDNHIGSLEKLLTRALWWAAGLVDNMILVKTSGNGLAVIFVSLFVAVDVTSRNFFRK